MDSFDQYFDKYKKTPDIDRAEKVMDWVVLVAVWTLVMFCSVALLVLAAMLVKYGGPWVLAACGGAVLGMTVACVVIISRRRKVYEAADWEIVGGVVFSLIVCGVHAILPVLESWAGK